MTSWINCQRPTTCARAALAAILVLMIFVCQAPVWAGPPDNAAGFHSAPALAVMGSFVNDVVGNRTRMIQVTCVIVAIGIFVLTRTYR